MADKLPTVNCSRGAPMGRFSYGPQPDEPRSVKLSVVRLDSGGYDSGGAYWGHSGERLYWARTSDDSYRHFVRATNRAKAALLLELPAEVMVRPPYAEAERMKSRSKLKTASQDLKDQVADMEELGYIRCE